MGKRSKEYLYEIGQYVNVTLKIVGQIRMPRGKSTQKGYIVQSVVYPTAEPYEIVESSLKRGSGCRYKAGRRIFEGNSLYSHKEIRDNLIDIEQAKTVARKSSTEKILFQCEYEDCNHTKIMLPLTLVNNGFGCPICSRGISYPELFFMGYNKEKDAGFVPQQTFKDFSNYRFDFVNYESRIIVETHGMQHYEEDNYMNHKRTVASDEAKREYCKENNWILIELDCRESSFEFIRNNITTEPLLEDITDNDVKGILEIIKLNKHYPIKEIIKMYKVDKLSICTIAGELGLTDAVVKGVLDRNNVELRRSGVQVGNMAHNRKYVRCIETGVIYESITDAKLKTGVHGISSVCNGKAKSARGYTWEFVTEETRQIV